MEAEFIKNAIITFFTSMVPVVELRGGIPLGVSLGLKPMEAMVICIIGNMFPVPFIILFIRRIFVWIKKHLPKLGGLIDTIEKHADEKGESVRRLQMLGLFLFVAIPIPGTGAWTGSLIAALMDMRLKKAMPSIMLGIITAGILITGLVYGFVAVLA